MPTPKLDLALKYFTATQARKELGLSRFQFDHRIAQGIFPKPTYTDKTGKQCVRYFDEDWVEIAKAILNNAIHSGGSGK